MLVAHEACPGAAVKCKEETAMWNLKPSWLPLMLSLLCSPLCRWGQLFCPPAHVPESGLPVLPGGPEPSCLPFILALPVPAWSERREKEGYSVLVKLPGAKPTTLHRRRPWGGQAGGRTGPHGPPAWGRSQTHTSRYVTEMLWGCLSCQVFSGFLLFF